VDRGEIFWNFNAIESSDTSKSGEWLPLIKYMGDLQTFIDSLMPENSMEKMFDLCFRKIEADSAFVKTCEVLNTRWRGINDSPENKLLLLSWLFN